MRKNWKRLIFGASFAQHSVVQASNEIPVFVIGSGRGDRRQFMNLQLAKSGFVDVTWLEGPNKPAVPDELIAALKTRSSQMTEGEFSCTLKHYLALQMFLQTNKNFAVICEDSIEIRESYSKRLSEYLALLPRAFDILFDGDLMKIPGFRGEYESFLGEGFSVMKMDRKASDWADGATNGANCYLITRRAAAKVTRDFLPFDKVIDHYLNDIIRRKKLNVYWPLPPAVHKRVLVSTVQFDEDGSPAALL